VVVIANLSLKFLGRQTRLITEGCQVCQSALCTSVSKSGVDEGGKSGLDDGDSDGGCGLAGCTGVSSGVEDCGKSDVDEDGKSVVDGGGSDGGCGLAVCTSVSKSGVDEGGKSAVDGSGGSDGGWGSVVCASVSKSGVDDGGKSGVDGGGSDGGWGSAVCSFSLDDINHVFDTSDFLEKKDDESAWQPAPADTVPTPRPGQVRLIKRVGST